MTEENATIKHADVMWVAVGHFMNDQWYFPRKVGQ